MVLDVRQPTITLHLYNRSKDTAHSFFLQTHPPHSFHVRPAFGTVPAHSSVPIVLSFTQPSASDLWRAHTTLNGFVRVRSVDGFALERVSVVARTGPTLQVLSCGVDFGVFDSSHSSSGAAHGLSGGHKSEAASAQALVAAAVSVASGHVRTRRVYVRNTSSALSCACIVQCATEWQVEDDSPASASAKSRAAAAQDKKSIEATASGSVVPARRALFSAVPRLLFIRPGEIKAIRVRFAPPPLSHSNSHSHSHSQSAGHSSALRGAVSAGGDVPYRSLLSIVGMGDEYYTVNTPTK